MKLLALLLILLVEVLAFVPANALADEVEPTGCYGTVCWWPASAEEEAEPIEEGGPEEAEAPVAAPTPVAAAQRAVTPAQGIGRAYRVAHKPRRHRRHHRSR